MFLHLQLFVVFAGRTFYYLVGAEVPKQNKQLEDAVQGETHFLIREYES